MTDGTRLTTLTARWSRRLRPALGRARGPDVVVRAQVKGAAVDNNKVKALMARARREVDDGLLPSCQLALARHGEIVAAATFGEASDDSRYLAWSVAKGVTASAAWALFSEGRLDPEAPVASYLPGFGDNGKEAVTVEHLLLHTAGFPLAPLAPDEWGSSQSRRRAFSRWRLEWPAGTRYAYHPVSSYWVVAELIETLGGEDYRAFLHHRVLDRLGLTRLRLGEDPDRQSDVVDMVLAGEPAAPGEHVAAGLPAPPDGDLSMDPFALALNDPGARAIGIPAGGLIGTASDIALYYQALLRPPDEVWDPAVIADATSVIRNRLADPSRDGIPANRTRGLVVAGDDGYGWLRMWFGRSVSPRTFGHDGAYGQVAWADPVSGLSFSYVTNGLDRNTARHSVRAIELSTLAGACA
ncbi:MAG TPA: serine hydrolase domain-containing protein [Acidimicrobiales bacterium]|nr:serine hydrolase domain-containing protein [Acidimicrobiales bacterium]